MDENAKAIRQFFNRLSREQEKKARLREQDRKANLAAFQRWTNK